VKLAQFHSKFIMEKLCKHIWFSVFTWCSGQHYFCAIISVKGRLHLLLKSSTSEHARYWTICSEEHLHFNFGTEFLLENPMFVELHISNLQGLNIMFLHG
jgi:hypothetical protein